MRTRYRIEAFTLVEILVVIAILAIVVALTASGFRNMGRASALKIATEEVHSALSGARAKTLASDGDTVYGVRVGTSSVTRFTGTTYVVGDPQNVTYVFEGGVSATGTFVASSTDILFSRLTGASNASGTIRLVGESDFSSTTVRIHASGLIEY
jgi:prepilin-type N-terminal cleavage/methylation domain-containing protein